MGKEKDLPKNQESEPPSSFDKKKTGYNQQFSSAGNPTFANNKTVFGSREKRPRFA